MHKSHRVICYTDGVSSNYKKGERYRGNRKEIGGTSNGNGTRNLNK